MEADDALSAYFTTTPIKFKSPNTTPRAPSCSDVEQYLSAPPPRFNKSLASTPSAQPPPVSPAKAPVVKPVNLKNILSRVGAAEGQLLTQTKTSSRIGVDAAQTPKGQKDQLIRELRTGKSDVTFRPLPQSRRLNQFTH